MPTSKTAATPGPRADATRRRVIDAAERLLRDGSPDFSMRDLAAAAGVSFATPFNQFGSKAAIMQALSALRIAAMSDRFEAARPDGDAALRVLFAVDVAVAVMLAEPRVNRAVIGSLGAPQGEPGQVQAQSRALWAKALGEGDGLDPETAEFARALLPEQLAVALRGVLSFWTAGEIGDDELARRARTAACVALLGFLRDEGRGAILARLGTLST